MTTVSCGKIGMQKVFWMQGQASEVPSDCEKNLRTKFQLSKFAWHFAEGLPF